MADDTIVCWKPNTSPVYAKDKELCANPAVYNVNTTRPTLST